MLLFGGEEGVLLLLLLLLISILLPLSVLLLTLFFFAEEGLLNSPLFFILFPALLPIETLILFLLDVLVFSFSVNLTPLLELEAEGEADEAVDVDLSAGVFAVCFNLDRIGYIEGGRKKE